MSRLLRPRRTPRALRVLRLAMAESKPRFAFSEASEDNLAFVLGGAPPTRHGVLCVTLLSKLYLLYKHGVIAGQLKSEISACNLRSAGSMLLSEAQQLAFHIGVKTFADVSRSLNSVI